VAGALTPYFFFAGFLPAALRLLKILSCALALLARISTLDRKETRE